jgi:hypothetical protein
MASEPTRHDAADREALWFNTVTPTYLRIPSWMTFDTPLRKCRWRRCQTLTEEQTAWLTRFA